MGNKFLGVKNEQIRIPFIHGDLTLHIWIKTLPGFKAEDIAISFIVALHILRTDVKIRPTSDCLPIIGIVVVEEAAPANVISGLAVITGTGIVPIPAVFIINIFITVIPLAISVGMIVFALQFIGPLCIRYINILA